MAWILAGRQLLIALWEPFDCIDCELLIAKLNAYEFDTSSLAFTYSYLSERKQRTKINSSFSCWAEILFGAPQCPILGPFLFNAYKCDLFFEVRDLEYASFANDITPYTCLPEIIHILEKLEKGIQDILDSCSENYSQCW